MSHRVIMDLLTSGFEPEFLRRTGMTPAILDRPSVMTFQEQVVWLTVGPRWLPGELGS